MNRTLLTTLLLTTGCFDFGDEDKDGEAGAPPFIVGGTGSDGGGDGSGDGSGDGNGGGSGSGSGQGSNADADDDGDGFTNGEEEEAGTNPDYAYSRPYEGGYNVGFCETPPEPTGPSGTASITQDGTTYEWPALAMGDVPENLTFMDQHGEMVDLYSFCGKHVMVLVSAGWCGPCRYLAEEVQDIQDEWREEGLQIIELITADNYGDAPDQAFVQAWANDYNFEDVPVLAVPGPPTSYNHVQFLFDADGYIPSVYHLNERLEVVSPDQSVHDPSNWL